MTYSKTSAFAAILATAGLAITVASPAIAEQMTPARDFEVRFTYDQTELETHEGAQNVLNRMERVIRSECGADKRHVNPNRKDVLTCIDTTMKATIAKIGSTSLVSAYETRSAG